jgi:hypothetical protein
MRLIKTFILRLYFDPEIPDRLCGDMHPLEDAENYPFKNRMEFQELLLRLIKRQPAAQKSPAGADTHPVV